MTLLQLVVLAVVQGVTEFLPISSSAHLILVPEFTGWEDQGLVMDVAVHVGTLLAVMLYFWRDLWEMAFGLVRLAKGRSDPGARLFGLIILGTFPLVAGGYFLMPYVAGPWRGIEIIAWSTLIGAILLFVADKLCMTIKAVHHVSYVEALVIGCAQVLALIPGTSRSGITITAARFLGYERAEAARFSMLLSIPAILAAGTLTGRELYLAGDAQVTFDAVLAGGLAFLTALLAIAIMMAWLRRASFTPFVLYRLILAGVLLFVVYA